MSIKKIAITVATIVIIGLVVTTIRNNSWIDTIIEDVWKEIWGIITDIIPAAPVEG
jgi:hypothetical protein